MTDDDKKKLGVELCRRWKQKFDARDIAYWCKELDGFELSQIVSALTKWKNTQRMVPKIPEIVKLMPGRAMSKPAGERFDEGSFAHVLREQNRQLSGRGDAETYLRYHRNLWVLHGSKSINVDGARRQITRSCLTCLANCGVADGDAARMVEFIFDSVEMFRALLEDLRNSEPQPEVQTPFDEQEAAYAGHV